MTQSIIETLIALEQERCNAIVSQDWKRLSALLSDSLAHTHTRGNSDDKVSYLEYMANVVEMLDVQREDLRVIILDENVVLMRGRQINQARLRRDPSQQARVESVVTQVWLREPDGNWRLVSFQATPLGPVPGS